MADDFSLFSSVRYDPLLKETPSRGLDFAGWNHHNASPLYMFDYHRDRIVRAATHWSWQPVLDALSGDEGLEQLARKVEEFVGPSQTTPLLVRIIVDRAGNLSFAKFERPSLPLENLFPVRLPPPGQESAVNEPQRTPRYTLVVDETSTAKSEYTHFKTTRRGMYDSARERADIVPGQLKEVLIVNQENGSVMEGSVTTPYFWRDGRWITPPVSNKFNQTQDSGGQDGTTRRWALERDLATEQVVEASSLVDGEECWLSNGSGFVSALIQQRG